MIQQHGSADPVNNSPVHSRRGLRLSLFLLAVGLTAFCSIHFRPALRTPLFYSGLTLSFFGMLGIRHSWRSNGKFGPILIIAVISRCFLLPLDHSDDLNRYLWEGKLQTRGLNPFAVSPLDNRAKPLRDQVWQGINHRDFSTIYGPVAQLTFRLAASLWYHPLSMKIVMVLFDLGTLYLLLLFLRKRKSRLNEAFLYAVNPLVLYSFAAEAHVESLMLFMIVAALLLSRQRRYPLMFAMLGCASLVKIIALIFVPFFLRKGTIRYAPFIALSLLLALPYGLEVLSLLPTTMRFGSKIHFNGFAYNLLSGFTPHDATIVFCMFLFSIAYLAIFFLTPDPVRACANAALCFLLLSPTAHPWYFAILAVFTVLFPIKSWIMLTGTISFSWTVTFSYIATGVWRESLAAVAGQYIAPLLVHLRARWRDPEFRSPDFGIPERISVVIPVLNEGKNMGGCLDSIRLPRDTLSEIIVVDGGSTDSTVAGAKRDPRVRTIFSKRGRGIQIAAGVRQAKGDLIVIVHADSRLAPSCIEEIRNFCSTHPQVPGGSVAARFSEPGLRYTVVAMLNNVRARFTGISFGDQVQFFRAAALTSPFPELKLMEDIELSMRLKKQGPVVMLPGLAFSSVRRWRSSNYLGNMALVMRLTASYLIRRRFDILGTDNEEYHRAYYETEPGRS